MADLQAAIAAFRGANFAFESANDNWLMCWRAITGSDSSPAIGTPYEELFPASAFPGGVGLSVGALREAYRSGQSLSRVMPNVEGFDAVKVNYVPLFQTDGNPWGVAVHWHLQHPETLQRLLPLLAGAVWPEAEPEPDPI